MITKLKEKKAHKQNEKLLKEHSDAKEMEEFRNKSANNLKNEMDETKRGMDVLIENFNNSIDDNEKNKILSEISSQGESLGAKLIKSTAFSDIGKKIASHQQD